MGNHNSRNQVARIVDYSDLVTAVDQYSKRWDENGEQCLVASIAMVLSYHVNNRLKRIATKLISDDPLRAAFGKPIVKTDTYENIRSIQLKFGMQRNEVTDYDDITIEHICYALKTQGPMIFSFKHKTPIDEAEGHAVVIVGCSLKDQLLFTIDPADVQGYEDETKAVALGDLLARIDQSMCSALWWFEPEHLSQHLLNEWQRFHCWYQGPRWLLNAANAPQLGTEIEELIFDYL